MWSNIRAGLGPARPNEGTAWFRAGLGHCFYTSAGTARPKNCLGFLGPNPFGTKHDEFGPDQPGTAQFPALYTHMLRQIVTTLLSYRPHCVHEYILTNILFTRNKSITYGAVI
jgi:hypothetical protein